MEIRLATSADAEVLSALNSDVQGLHARLLPHLFKPPSPEVFPASLVRELVAQPGAYFYLALEDAEPVGYIYVEIRRQPETPYRYAFDMLYINHISVRPEHRHKGCARALFDQAVLLARQNDLHLIALDVWSFNANAHGFFQAYGFENFNERMWMKI